MIRNSLLVALALLVIYQLVQPRLPHRFYLVQGQRREGFLTAQNFVYRSHQETNLLLGSSMTMMLSQSILGPGFYKLSFGGGTPLTGLEIIRRSGVKPAVVFIEINNILANQDEELLKDLFGPVAFPLRRGLSSLREEGRPSNYLAGALEATVRKMCRWCSRPRAAGPAPTGAPAPEKPLDPKQFEQLLRIQNEAQEHAPPPELLHSQVNRLAEQVDAVSRQGVACVFVEMPNHPAIARLARPTAIRTAMEERFARTKYRWFPSEPSQYATRDGIHLTRVDADRFSKAIVDYVNEMNREVTATATVTKHSR